MRLLLPILSILVGVGAGAGAGIFLGETEDKSCEVADCDTSAAKATATDRKAAEADATDDGELTEFVRLQNQFVIPVVRDELVRSLVVMSLSLEVTAAGVDSVYSREPKLRDAFLRVLFDHAHVGGFDGTFTESSRLSSLRVALLEAAQATLGAEVHDILITDIVRQEV